MRWVLVFAAVAALFCASAATAQTLSAAKHSDPVPADVAPKLKALVADGGVRVTAGPATMDFWWVKALPVAKGAGASTWNEVDEGSFVGVAKLSGVYRDIRGRTLKPGTYTLRYALQPQNGDHLGVSPFREFLLLSPVAVDTDPAPTGHDGTVDLSKQSIGIAHPAVLSIDPPAATGAPLEVVSRPEAELTGIIFELPVSQDGKPVGSIKFGLILVGKIEA